MSQDDLKNTPLSHQVKQIATELADQKQDDGASWQAEINRRLEGAKPDRQ